MKRFFLVLLSVGCVIGIAQADGISTSNADSARGVANIPAAALAVLYDQMDNAGSNSHISQDFETANDQYDSQLADDFVVPVGQIWSISGVDVLGAYWNGPGPADSFNVFFYANAGGLPGAPVGTRLAQPNTSDANAVISLSSPVLLTAGTYWVSVQARMDLSPGGQWGVTERTVLSNGPAAWLNAGGGFGSGCTTWGVKSSCIVGSGPDLAFRLNGSLGGGSGTFPPDENFDLVVAPALPGGWTTTASGGGVAWKTVTTSAHTAPNAAFAPNVGSVSDMTLNSPAFIPASGQTLSFKHSYGLENSFDGAVLEISTDGGASFQDILAAGGGFLTGGYIGVISSSFSSPIAGRYAWTGNSGGFVAASVVLPATAAGKPTVLRFRTASDSSVGAAGWWVDSIHLGGPEWIFCAGFESGENGSCTGL